VGCYIWYSEKGPGRAAARPVPSSLYQMQQPTHKRPVYQLIYSIIASDFYRVNKWLQTIIVTNEVTNTSHYKQHLTDCCLAIKIAIIFTLLT